MKVRKILSIVLIFILLVSFSSGCKKSGGFLNLNSPKKGDQVAIIETSMGNIKVMFFKQVAPKAVENFITHSQQGYYNNVIFHRVIKNFMIQSGDPQGTGRGGESIWGKPFANEVSENARNFRGALAMANSGAGTNGSQFYIVQAGTGNIDRTLAQAQAQSSMKMTQDAIDEYKKAGGAPWLDGGYTVFGQVIDGMDVVDKIAAVSVDKSNKPLTPVTIKKIDVETAD
jgi:peptidyl-prolyl cis-trans isomerase B (cyclophilin B)